MTLQWGHDDVAVEDVSAIGVDVGACTQLQWGHDDVAVEDA